MARKGLVALVALAVCAVTGCVSQHRAPVDPGRGLIFTDVRSPLETNFSATPLGSKRAYEDVTYLVVPLLFPPLDFAFGDADVARIASDGGMSTVHYSEYEFLSILGIYNRFRIHVYGD